MSAPALPHEPRSIESASNAKFMVMVWENIDKSNYCHEWRKRIAQDEMLQNQDMGGWAVEIKPEQIDVPYGPYVMQKLIGVSFMDMKTFFFPPAIDYWDGRERLTQNALSLQDSDIRSQLLSNNKVAKILPHLSILGSCGRGKNLLDIMRRLASNCGSNFMAIEALKPLDTTFYCNYGFYSTTPAFYPIDEANTLMPMFHKFSSIEDCPFVDKSVFSKEFQKWPLSQIDDTIINNANIVLKFLSTFLWKVKSHEYAAELLRRVVFRQNLKISDASKLWRMRLHCLSYKSGTAIESEVPPIKDSWFDTRHAISNDVIKCIREKMVTKTEAEIL
jgi:hypothetical protein